MIEFAMDQDELGKKIISNIDRHFRVDPKMYLKKKRNPGALGTCPVCPLVKTALNRATGRNPKHV